MSENDEVQLDVPNDETVPDTVYPMDANMVDVDAKMDFISQLTVDHEMRYSARVTENGSVVTKNDCILFAFHKVLFRQPLSKVAGKLIVPPSALMCMALATLTLKGKDLVVTSDKNTRVAKDVIDEFKAANMAPYDYWRSFSDLVNFKMKDISSLLSRACPITVDESSTLAIPKLAATPSTFSRLLSMHVPGIYVTMLMFKVLAKYPDSHDDAASGGTVRRELILGSKDVAALSIIDLNTISFDNINASRAFQYALESEKGYCEKQMKRSSGIKPFFYTVIDDMYECMTVAGLIGALVPDFKTSGLFDSVATLQAAMLAASELSFLRPQVRMVKVAAANLTVDGLERHMDKLLYLANATCGYDIDSVLRNPSSADGQLFFNTRLNPESTGVLCMMILASIEDASVNQLLRLEESNIGANVLDAVEYYARTVPFFRVLLSMMTPTGGEPQKIKISTSTVISAFHETWGTLVSMTTYPVSSSDRQLTAKVGLDRDRELADTLFSLALGVNGWNALNASYLPANVPAPLQQVVSEQQVDEAAGLFD